MIHDMFSAILVDLEMLCIQHHYNGVMLDINDVQLMTTASVSSEDDLEVGFVETCVCHGNRNTRGTHSRIP